MQQFNLELQYDHSETNGDLFDDMDMKLQAIASMSGMSDIFWSQAADVYKFFQLNKIKYFIISQSYLNKMKI